MPGMVLTVWAEAPPPSPPLGLPRPSTAVSLFDMAATAPFAPTPSAQPAASAKEEDQEEEEVTSVVDVEEEDAASEKDGKKEEDAAPAEEDNGETE